MHFYSSSPFLGSVAIGDLNFTSTQQMPPPSFILVRPLTSPPGGPLATPPSIPLATTSTSATAHSNRSTSEQSHSPLHPTQTLLNVLNNF
jgi:hypothetical protein